MPERKPKMTREQAERSLAAGEQIAAAGRFVRAGLSPRETRHTLDQLFGTGTELEAVVARTADGRLTRAGAEFHIRNGGSVMFVPGEVITDAEDIPDDAALEGLYQQREQELLQTHRQQVDHLRRHMERTAPAPARSAAAPRAAAERPARSASRGDWDAYARAKGVNPDEFGTKEELQKEVARVTGDEDE